MLQEFTPFLDAAAFGTCDGTHQAIPKQTLHLGVVQRTLLDLPNIEPPNIGRSGR